MHNIATENRMSVVYPFNILISTCNGLSYPFQRQAPPTPLPCAHRGNRIFLLLLTCLLSAHLSSKIGGCGLLSSLPPFLSLSFFLSPFFSLPLHNPLIKYPLCMACLFISVSHPLLPTHLGPTEASGGGPLACLLPPLRDLRRFYLNHYRPTIF